MIAAGNTLEEAHAFAQALSLESSNYVTLSTCFGIFATTSKRLHVHAPSDSIGNSYWLKGIEHSFTDAQRGADERATPDLH